MTQDVMARANVRKSSHTVQGSRLRAKVIDISSFCQQDVKIMSFSDSLIERLNT
jgi:hypothetical protein